MKTTTIESENPELVNASDAQEKPPCEFPDPDRVIEGTGGTSDSGGEAHIGPPPPAQTY